MKVIFYDTIKKKTYEREIDNEYLHIIEQWRKDSGCMSTNCLHCPFLIKRISCKRKGFDRLSVKGRYKISFLISMTLFD